MAAKSSMKLQKQRNDNFTLRQYDSGKREEYLNQPSSSKTGWDNSIGTFNTQLKEGKKQIWTSFTGQVDESQD